LLALAGNISMVWIANSESWRRGSQQKAGEGDSLGDESSPGRHELAMQRNEEKKREKDGQV
jgi:hypothetical protein